MAGPNKSRRLAQSSSGPGQSSTVQEKARPASKQDGRGSRDLRNFSSYPEHPSLRRARRRERYVAPGYVSRQEYLCDLLAEQKSLHQRISAQSRLLKVDRLQVNSVETEFHRQITNEIIRVSALMCATLAPGEYTTSGFSRRETSDQIIFDRLYAQQGIRSLASRTDETRKTMPRDGQTGKYLCGNPKLSQSFVSNLGLQLFRLEGPALRLYLKALERGYRGGPNDWVRSRYCRQALPVLQRRGLIGPVAKRDLHCFCDRSPLRFVLRMNTSMQHAVSHGFHGERLVRDGTISVLVRQSKVHAPGTWWPRVNGKTIWPSTPTLFESWQALAQGCKPWPGYVVPITTTVRRCSLREVRENSELAKRIVRANVLGIRAWVPLPEKLRWYFKYRWGFLILRPKVPLSIAVVRFLLSLWKRAPLQCFLLERFSLRNFLRTRVRGEWYTLSSHTDRRLRNFLSTGPIPRGEEEPDSIRPCQPMRFVKSTSAGPRSSTKLSGGVRLTDPTG